MFSKRRVNKITCDYNVAIFGLLEMVCLVVLLENLTPTFPTNTKSNQISMVSYFHVSLD